MEKAITTLSFISVFDLWAFKQQANILSAEIKVNHLTGEFTEDQIQLAVSHFHATVFIEEAASSTS